MADNIRCIAQLAQLLAEGLQGAVNVLGGLVGVGEQFLRIAYPQAEAFVGLCEEDVHRYAPLAAKRADKSSVEVAEKHIVHAQVFRECVGQYPISLYAVDAETLVAKAESVAVVERDAVLQR